MIKFEFIVDDHEAEAIMSVVHECAIKNDSLIIESLSDLSLSEHERNARVNWYSEHKKFIMSLLAKMKNRKCSMIEFELVENAICAKLSLDVKIQDQLPEFPLLFQKFAYLIIQEAADAADMARVADCKYPGDYIVEHFGLGNDCGAATWRANQEEDK